MTDDSDRHWRERLWGVLPDLAIALAIATVVTLVLLWDRGGPRSWPEEVGDGETASAPTVRAGPRRVRAPAVAGQFYPADPGALYAEVERLLAEAPAVGLRGTRAVLVPHAGYVYSGAVAAASFREVAAAFERGQVRRAVLLASNHRGDVDLDGVSIPDVTHYAVPGTEVPLDAVVEELRHHDLVTCVPGAHTMHMLEVEVPFLAHLAGLVSGDRAGTTHAGRTVSLTLVPMIVGRLAPEQIDVLADLLAALDDGRTLFVFSVDLSHYHPAERARQLDTYSLHALMSLDAAALARATTDANHLLQALVGLARRRNWEPTFLMYRHSGDVSGDRERVVGYGSVAFAEPLALTRDEERALVGYARQVVDEYVRRGTAPAAGPDLLDRHPVLRLPRGVFVTLEKGRDLRGCIGHLISRGALHEGIRTCAVQAAAEDPRFSPVSADELGEISVSVSVLEFPSPLRVEDPEEYLTALNPHRDGVILMAGQRQSTFLPTVWEQYPDPRQFLQRLCQKGGSPSDCWRDPATTVYRYGSFEVREEDVAAR